MNSEQALVAETLESSLLPCPPRVALVPGVQLNA